MADLIQHNLPQVESSPKKTATVLGIVAIGHALVFWGLLKVKTIEVGAVDTPPIAVQFVKIQAPIAEPAQPPLPQEKPIEPVKPTEKPVEPVKPIEKPQPTPKPQPTVISTNIPNVKTQNFHSQVDHKPETKQDDSQFKAEQERLAKEQAAREQAARDQAARDQTAREQAARDQAAKDQAAKEQAQTPQMISEGALQWLRGRPTIRSETLEKYLKSKQSVSITISFKADASGKITDANVSRSSGIPGLDSAALRSVQAARLKPYPHPVQANVSFSLLLK
ncbi:MULTISPECIES: TonB family protein [unclassified Acinetobacter]|uniref:energy transducer TonB family protein n=1 Tax=unclassified Acinetobacter TaxID=196816 RepID=UPI0035B9BD20